MNMIKGNGYTSGTFSLDFNNLVEKLIILRDMYRQTSRKMLDPMLREQSRRLALQKSIFLKDFHNVQHFNINSYIKKQGDRIATQQKYLSIQFHHLIMENDAISMLNYFIGREQELVSDYYKKMLNALSESDDEFTRMVLKNQKDETKQSIDELKDLKTTYKIEKTDYEK
jgi:hypothetical protein